MDEAPMILGAAERRNRGWLTSKNCPPARVYLDGVELRHVVAVHRKSGRVRLIDSPPRLDKRGKSFVERAVRGRVRVEIIHGK
ncbi:MAG: hypothetical protein WBA83_16875 [Burkholderiaceae bacterium]